jgi:hypothetical protein
MFEPSLESRNECNQCGGVCHGKAARYRTLTILGEIPRRIKVCDSCQCKKCIPED